MKVNDRAAKNVSRVVEGKFDVGSHIGDDIVSEGDGMRNNFPNILLVEGGVLAFPAVNIEIVELVERHKHLRWF